MQTRQLLLPRDTILLSSEVSVVLNNLSSDANPNLPKRRFSHE